MLPWEHLLSLRNLNFSFHGLPCTGTESCQLGSLMGDLFPRSFIFRVSLARYKLLLSPGGHFKESCFGAEQKREKCPWQVINKNWASFRFANSIEIHWKPVTNVPHCYRILMGADSVHGGTGGMLTSLCFHAVLLWTQKCSKI